MAVASSACCWLPLLLIAVGVTAGGIGVFFETYRWLFLGLTAGLLGAGFYFAYFRKPQCEPGDACAVPNRRLERLNRVTLWMATAFAASFALYPNYMGYLLGNDDEPTAIAAVDKTAPSAPNSFAAGANTRDYDVVGMSCEGCTAHVKTAVAELPGVTAVQVSFEERIARVTFAPDVQADDRAVLAAIEEVGYEASVATRALRSGDE